MFLCFFRVVIHDIIHLIMFWIVWIPFYFAWVSFICVKLCKEGNILGMGVCVCTFCWMVECFCSMSLFSLAASTTSWSNCKRQTWLVKLIQPPGLMQFIQISIHQPLKGLIQDKIWTCCTLAFDLTSLTITTIAGEKIKEKMKVIKSNTGPLKWKTLLSNCTWKGVCECMCTNASLFPFPILTA